MQWRGNVARQRRKITGFKVEGRRKIRITVLLDDEPWEELDAETVVRESLQSGQLLDEERRRAILLTDETIRARRAAAGFTARAPKSRRELEHYLAQRGFSAAASEQALTYLDESGIIDDAQTAGKVARTQRRRKYGPRRILAELQARGIDSSVARRNVEQATEGVDLEAECSELALKVLERYRPLSDPRNRRRLSQYLLRRGYDGEMVHKAVKAAAASADSDAGSEEFES